MSGATSFTLGDRLPRMTLDASTSAPAWKRTVSLSGRLTNALGLPFKGATIVLESSQDGDGWKTIASAKTGLSGAYSLNWTPITRVRVRARFVAPATYMPVASTATTIAPKPSITPPVVPRAISHAQTFTVRGTLTPRHAADSGAVTLRVQRLVSGVWTDHSSLTATCRDSATGSAYGRSLRLTAGTWRIRAQMQADAAHAAGSSAWSQFVVR